MSAIEQRARELLAAEFDARGLVEPARELRSGDSLASMEPGFAASVAAVIAALTPPEGFVLVPVEVQQEAKRFRWLKTCSREQYLIARGAFGLADDVIDAVILSEAEDISDGE